MRFIKKEIVDNEIKWIFPELACGYIYTNESDIIEFAERIEHHVISILYDKAKNMSDKEIMDLYDDHYTDYPLRDFGTNAALAIFEEEEGAK